MKSRPNKNYVLQVMRDDFGVGDEWGIAMAWAFAIAETLTVLGAEVPEEMEYRPSPFVKKGTPEAYYPESYEDAEIWEYLGEPQTAVWDADTEARISEVQFAGKCLARYLDWLRAAGMDY